MPDKKTLDYYVSELRRIEKSRQADSEKEIKKIYRELKKDLNSFLANEYADFSNGNGILSVALLQEKARYAKFLEEVDEHLNSITPGVSKAIQNTVKKTYKAVYEGMIDAVTSSVDSNELKTKLKGLSIRPEVMNRAINNPISGLTLPDTLEKHRKDVIYNIKQQINTGLMTGERYDTMAKNINKVLSGDDGTGGMYGKAIRIVRTEVHRVQEEGLIDCAKDISESLEGSGLIYAVTWHNMGDQKVRPNVRRHTSKGWKTYKSKTTANHEKLEGMTIKVGDKFEIEPGVFAECPGSSGTARNDCNCRCFLEYRLMNVEEFAAATGKSVEQVKKENGIVENSNTEIQPQSAYNKFGQEIKFDDTINEGENWKETKNILLELSSEYDTKLTEVQAFRRSYTGGNANLGETDIFGIMRLSSTKEDIAIHEFAHSLTLTQDKKYTDYGVVWDKRCENFWKEIRKTYREYKNKLRFEPYLRISIYANDNVDEFFAEAFTHAKLKEMGIAINSSSYGDDFTYSDKVLSIANKYFRKSVAKSAESGIINISNEQFGKKIGKHAKDYGLDASDENDREKMKKIILDVVNNNNEIRKGNWRGIDEDVLFYIKNEDVVVAKTNKDFVTILKGGVENERVKNARKQ